ncbi:DUF1540 domain-containing protein [Alkaliphilus sp. B6464]|uniref:DUF1540 domain-containing protein n=1 Tax=Alkaliphilus sp. B6464 TaxID=2731219 RepID=UPI001BAD4C19|nr:DUF1540 domain-containing protein [Alkaliphilus sp. B6464]QUH20030.1 DUF1540 domain-containing protein [Alkaliphilus sp. B6464]
MENNRITVKCGVDTCNFYKNNYCYANSIEVNPQGTGKSKTSDETQCTTFIPGK